MATQIQWRRGTTAQTASFTGAVGEITVDTDKNTLVVHDNSTVGGFALARESAVTSNAIFSQAAFNTANASFLQANTPSHVANSAAVYANGAFAAANAADSKATSAGSYANAAFTRANNSINANTGGTIVGDLNISGNLTVTGFTTYTNTTTLLVADNIITVNAAINQSSQPVVNEIPHSCGLKLLVNGQQITVMVLFLLQQIRQKLMLTVPLQLLMLQVM